MQPVIQAAQNADGTQDRELAKLPLVVKSVE